MKYDDRIGIYITCGIKPRQDFEERVNDPEINEERDDKTIVCRTALRWTEVGSNETKE